MRTVSVSAPWIPRSRMIGLLSIVGLLSAVLGADAAETYTVYRCVSADGAVTLQDQPCPADSDSEERRFRDQGGTAAPVAAVPPVPADPTTSPPVSPVAAPRPPPARWRCVDIDGQARVSDRNDPRGRWVPAWTLGISSEPAGLAGRAGRAPPQLPSQPPPAEVAAARQRAQAQVYVEDRCRPMSLAETCQHLREQLEETRRRRFNQQPSGRAESDVLIEQLQSELAGC
ncbi:DUF4124 domain-containing protein [Pseudomarimonas arenosa]|uniref:DUF4124 domain-containing protein n=1 Tax=Pseudomarimonas arenosa TaxID=2774145 RepID=A0AAW3ZQI7_9GAMM|nr:DUF4124 domain-containing protein [Pseudomarimonas arenosa]MBD8527749.1 DUF4124 domain-containing protein [Pseudomarimonas arenosa]